ncbi:MAG: RsmE family RNA methyltransferase [Planctomycetota bacterium]
MSLERFFAESPLPGPGVEIELGVEEARHLVSVYRATSGREVTLFDGSGVEVRARVVKAEKRLVRLEVIECLKVDRKPVVDIELAVALPRGGAADDVIRRALEVGASRIIPLETERSVYRAERKDEAKRRERFRRIAIASMKLSGRNSMPLLLGHRSLAELALPTGTLGFLGSTDPDAPFLSKIDLSAESAPCFRLVIGPEGGFSQDEIAALRSFGYRDLSFGPMVLRVQTAVVLGLGILAMR